MATFAENAAVDAKGPETSETRGERYGEKVRLHVMDTILPATLAQIMSTLSEGANINLNFSLELKRT